MVSKRTTKSHTLRKREFTLLEECQANHHILHRMGHFFTLENTDLINGHMIRACPPHNCAQVWENRLRERTAGSAIIKHGLKWLHSRVHEQLGGSRRHLSSNLCPVWYHGEPRCAISPLRFPTLLLPNGYDRQMIQTGSLVQREVPEG